MRVTKALASRITAAALFALVLLPVLATSAAAATPRVGRARALSTNTIGTRANREIDAWAAWLKANGAKGLVGEVGWPSDDPRWNTVANSWLTRADAAGIGVTTWVAGEWSSSMQLSGYGRSSYAVKSLDTANSNAIVAEGHFATSTEMRGVNGTGPEMGAAANEPTSSFSNVNYGSVDHTYHYDSAESYAFLAARGVRTVRLPFRWERVQRTLFGALDTDEMSRLGAAVHAAHAAGLQVVLDLHNFAGYYLADPVTGLGVRQTIGSAGLPINAFTDVWAKLANYFAGDTAVSAFDIMNEPIGMAARGRVPASRVWEQASQQAVNVIRATGDTRTLMVAGYEWSSMANWTRNHPVSWIKDPANNFRYEAHEYFDALHTGVYRSYDEEVHAITAR
ncbi:MAG: cellulase family glycosylhydrolase [Actinomycetota bacterium]